MLQEIDYKSHNENQRVLMGGLMHRVFESFFMVAQYMFFFMYLCKMGEKDSRRGNFIYWFD